MAEDGTERLIREAMAKPPRKPLLADEVDQLTRFHETVAAINAHFEVIWSLAREREYPTKKMLRDWDNTWIQEHEIPECAKGCGPLHLLMRHHAIYLDPAPEMKELDWDAWADAQPKYPWDESRLWHIAELAARLDMVNHLVRYLGIKDGLCAHIVLWRYGALSYGVAVHPVSPFGMTGEEDTATFELPKNPATRDDGPAAQKWFAETGRELFIELKTWQTALRAKLRHDTEAAGWPWPYDAEEPLKLRRDVLDLNEMRVLAFLCSKPARLHMYQDIAVAVDMSRQTVGKVVAVLELRGFVHVPKAKSGAKGRKGASVLEPGMEWMRSYGSTARAGTEVEGR